ncbi:MAG: hypothetical protein CMJ06_00785 [Pelagibacterales bacterium]|nr:hypothetical protein [Pelagibacterales bacterium]OUU63583.1 MAG: hypothetical protein CBC22_00755 [Alphaproteobacteria bacterium TMED62]|tara:strand:+ start:3545 stop:4012 length:468 start_codon:yes stop_codon:yes gene_type:complete
MYNFKFKKYFLLFFLLANLVINYTYATNYNEIIDKFFLNRKIDSIEGIWEKSFANQGPTGCVTMFYKDQSEYYQIHIEECFVIGKITGKQKKLDVTNYEGENAIYFYDGKVIWKPSSIIISNDLKSFSITHGSDNNKFVEKWKRIWPEEFHSYNK